MFGLCGGSWFHRSKALLDFSASNFLMNPFSKQTLSCLMCVLAKLLDDESVFILSLFSVLFRHLHSSLIGCVLRFPIDPGLAQQEELISHISSHISFLQQIKSQWEPLSDIFEGALLLCSSVISSVHSFCLKSQDFRKLNSFFSSLEVLSSLTLAEPIKEPHLHLADQITIFIGCRCNYIFSVLMLLSEEISSLCIAISVVH